QGRIVTASVEENDLSSRAYAVNEVIDFQPGKLNVGLRFRNGHIDRQNIVFPAYLSAMACVKNESNVCFGRVPCELADLTSQIGFRDVCHQLYSETYFLEQFSNCTGILRRVAELRQI